MFYKLLFRICSHILLISILLNAFFFLQLISGDEGRFLFLHQIWWRNKISIYHHPAHGHFIFVHRRRFFQMSLGGSSVAVVQLPGGQFQVQGVIQSAQSSVIQSPQVQAAQVSPNWHQSIASA